MRHEAAPSLPPQPLEIAEWEDLLVRLEIMPRALRSTLDGVPNGAEIDRIISEMVQREESAGRWLEVAATGEPADDSRGTRGPGIRNPVERFEALRLRNFSMVQRRGVEVWGWRATTGEGSEVTVYQLLSSLVLSDAEALLALRSARGNSAPARAAAC